MDPNALFAGLAIFVSLLSNRRSKETSQGAKRAESGLERIAAAQEAQAIANARAVPEKAVAWRIEWLSGEGYLLWNDGTATAREARIEVDESQHLLLRHEMAGDVMPNHAHKFLALQTMATTDTTVTVRWKDGAGAEHTWERPLPPKR